MKYIIKRITLAVILGAFFSSGYCQITYIDLYISQPNVEDCLTGIKTNFPEENIRVFPNPTQGLFTISLNNALLSGKIKMVVHNIEGQVLYSEDIDPEYNFIEKVIDLSGYPAGTYLLNISAGKKYYNAGIIIK